MLTAHSPRYSRWSHAQKRVLFGSAEKTPQEYSKKSKSSQKGPKWAVLDWGAANGGLRDGGLRKSEDI